MRVAPLHLRRDACGDVGKREMPRLLGHLRVEHDLEQQVAQFLAQRRHVALGDRIGNLIRFFDRVGCDRREVLRAVPRAAAGPAQSCHDPREAVEFGSGGGSSHRSWA
jgi:hypothetical protein